MEGKIKPLPNKNILATALLYNNNCTLCNVAGCSALQYSNLQLYTHVRSAGYAIVRAVFAAASSNDAYSFYFDRVSDICSHCQSHFCGHRNLG